MAGRPKKTNARERKTYALHPRLVDFISKTRGPRQSEGSFVEEALFEALLSGALGEYDQGLTLQDVASAWGKEPTELLSGCEPASKARLSSLPGGGICLEILEQRGEWTIVAQGLTKEDAKRALMPEY